MRTEKSGYVTLKIWRGTYEILTRVAAHRQLEDGTYHSRVATLEALVQKYSGQEIPVPENPPENKRQISIRTTPEAYEGLLLLQAKMALSQNTAPSMTQVVDTIVYRELLRYEEAIE